MTSSKSRRSHATDATPDYFAAHLEWCLRNRPSLQNHPVLFALFDLYVERLQLYVRFSVLARLAGPIPVGGGQFIDASLIADDLKELGGWIFKKTHRRLTGAEGIRLRNVFADRLGFSHDAAKEFARKSSPVVGRPNVRRALAMTAYELRLRESGLTWREITERVCDCPKLIHNDSCVENVLAGRKELIRLLRKYKHPLGTSPQA